MISPNVLSDSDGSYRLQAGPVVESPARGNAVGLEEVQQYMPMRQQGFQMYSTFSLWDTYRTLHPLMNLVHPERSKLFGRSLMAMSEEWGWLPPFQLIQSPTDMMT